MGSARFGDAFSGRLTEGGRLGAGMPEPMAFALFDVPVLPPLLDGERGSPSIIRPG